MPRSKESENIGAMQYQTIATERSSFGVNRHGVSSAKGGRVLETWTHFWPATPTHIAMGMMQDHFPNCDISHNIPPQGEE